MPPKKRALTESDGNSQPPRKRQSSDGKHSDTEDNDSNASDRSESPELPDDAVEKRPPYCYICIPRPYYVVNEPELDEDDVNATQESGAGAEMSQKPASDHPAWKYKMMASAYIRRSDQLQQASYRDPDNFDLNCYTDTYGYGILEVLENILIEYNNAWDKDNIDDMWSVTATLSHFLNTQEGEVWYNIDDGERSCEMGDVLGAALLGTLEKLHKAGELKSDSSKYLDLGLVMALHLKWSNFPAEIPLEEVRDWRPNLIGYAKKTGIDLTKQGVAGLDKYLKGDMDLPDISKIEEIKDSDDSDRWSYHKKFNQYKKKRGMGGDSGNILKWSREKRKKASYSGKDPLQHIPVKDLQEAADNGDLVLEQV